MNSLTLLLTRFHLMSGEYGVIFPFGGNIKRSAWDGQRVKAIIIQIVHYDFPVHQTGRVSFTMRSETLLTSWGHVPTVCQNPVP
jgi:hypothetical protein